MSNSLFSTLDHLHGKAVRLAALFLCVGAAFAHVGPPFPIINDHKIGNCMVALWTHPDVGIGTFFVLVDPVAGTKVPNDLKIMIGVQPVTGRLAEARYRMDPQSLHGQVQFNASVPFDRQELWRATIFLKGTGCSGKASATVEVTPPGFGAWDLLLFSLPFAGIGLLWFRVMTRKRRKPRRALAAQAKTAVAKERS